jgi:16S rRNA (uracil1498-N3)-methyltransferase
VIPRVFAPEACAAGDLLDVPSDEAHWLREVLRIGPGEPVRVFDGRGHEWEAAIATSAKRGVRVSLGTARSAAPETRIAYTLAMPVLKGDAADSVVRDAVMMGVVRILPFLSARSEASRAAVRRGQRRERWQRVAIASAKQCGRATVPMVDEVATFEAIIDAASMGNRLLFVEPTLGIGEAVADLVVPSAVLMATGPEGGWTSEEAQLAVNAGWRAARLGERVLRAEAAPLVALAACQAVWKDR